MGTSSFRAGVHIRIDGIEGTLFRKLDDETWQIEDKHTRRIREYRQGDLLALYQSGKLVFSVRPEGNFRRPYLPEAHADKAAWDIAKIRRQYVLAVMDMPSLGQQTKDVIHRTWEKLKNKPTKCPSEITVWRWKVRYLKAGRDIRALLPAKALRGNRKERYPDEVLASVAESIEDIYLTQERNTIQDTLDEAEHRVRKENKLRPSSQQLPLPTFNLVERTIARIPEFDRYVARYGRTAAEKRFRAVLHHHVTDAPLDRAQIDHTPLDLIVIDDESLLPLGRPYVTACLDCATRCVLGLHISFDPPSHLTVARCLQHAFMPKTSLLKSYPEVKNAWMAHGVMSGLDVDNGLEFHSDSFENGCYSLGIEIHYSPRKKAWFKGMIERFLKTFNENVSHGIPGTTFRNILEKDDYDPSKFAVVRWSTLKKIAHIWVVDVYHQKIHRSLGVPPALKWASGIRQEDIPLPDDPKSLNFIFGKCEERTLTHKGIELHGGLFYNSVELTYLRRRLGDSLRVEVRVDTSDLGHIVILAPDKAEMYDVPCLRLDYAASLSLYQHKICKRFANRHLGNYSPEGWLDAKSQIRKIVEEEIFLKKRRTRSKAARFRNMDATEPSTAESVPLTPALPVSSSSAADDFNRSLQDDVAPTPDRHPTSDSNASPRRITPRYRDGGPSE
ncbi:Mu transposase C-terminal domain-containing protein [Paraburkholderia gardini]|uniref:Integrase catalytic domain-containing protein n=1 Tax=Paraburkholderia gardini TaxID=2823469 RepID=A0ABN7QVE9_9BURK|nr:Mu transposase C-terminal domain-containing protein [Paraburkholderia gardini]CAG4915572.1 hypothetical protein R54767_04213 [Paraburkholderia gardini]